MLGTIIAVALFAGFCYIRESLHIAVDASAIRGGAPVEAFDDQIREVYYESYGENYEGFLQQPPKPKPCNLDLCIMIDGSGSVEFKSHGGSQTQCQAAGGSYNAVLDKCINYGQEVKFIHDMMQMFENDGDMGPQGVQIAAAVFSAKNHDIFKLGEFTSAHQMDEHSTFTFPRGKTYTKNAVQHCYNHLSNKAGYSHARENSTKMIILMTDGDPQCAYDPLTCPDTDNSQDPRELLGQIQDEGVHVAVVSIGSDWMGTDTLQRMKKWASQDELYYSLEGFSNDPILKPLKSQACALAHGIALPPQSISNNPNVPPEYWEDAAKAEALEKKKAEESVTAAQHAKAAETAAEASQKQTERAAQDAAELKTKAEQAEADERAAKDAAKKEADGQALAVKEQKAAQDAAEANELAKAAEQLAKDAAKREADAQALAAKEEKTARDDKVANDSANTALDEVKKEAAKAAQEALNEAHYVKHANRSITNSSTIEKSIKENPLYNTSVSPCDNLVQADLAEVISTVHSVVEELSVFNISNCHNIGHELVIMAEDKVRTAKSKLTDAQAKVQQASEIGVNFGSFNLAQLDGTSCDAMWRVEAYVTAEQAYAEAAMVLEQAAAQEQAVQDELAMAEAAASKEANGCRCKMQAKYHTELNLANEDVKKLAIAWQRGKEKQCLLMGISMEKCDTSGMPSLSNVAVPDFKCDSA